MTTKTTKAAPLMTFEDIRKEITLIDGQGKKWHERIHRCAVSVLSIWMKNGNKAECAAVLTELAEVTQYGKRAFGQWVLAHLPLEYSEETKAFYAPADTPDKLTKAQAVKAASIKFWEYKPAPTLAEALSDDDQVSRIEKLIKLIEKHHAKPVDGELVNLAALPHLRDAVVALRPIPH